MWTQRCPETKKAVSNCCTHCKNVLRKLVRMRLLFNAKIKTGPQLAAACKLNSPTTCVDTRDKFLAARDNHLKLKRETPGERNTRLQMNSSSVPTTVREEVSSQASLRQPDYDIIPESIFKRYISKGKSFKDSGVPVRIGLYDSSIYLVCVSGFQVPWFHRSIVCGMASHRMINNNNYLRI